MQKEKDSLQIKNIPNEVGLACKIEINSEVEAGISIHEKTDEALQLSVNNQ